MLPYVQAMSDAVKSLATDGMITHSEFRRMAVPVNLHMNEESIRAPFLKSVSRVQQLKIQLVKTDLVSVPNDVYRLLDSGEGMDTFVNQCVQKAQVSWGGFIRMALAGDSDERIAKVEQRYSDILRESFTNNPQLIGEMRTYPYCIIKKL